MHFFVFDEVSLHFGFNHLIYVDVQFVLQGGELLLELLLEDALAVADLSELLIDLFAILLMQEPVVHLLLHALQLRLARLEAE